MPWRGIGLPDRAGCLTFDMAGQFHRQSKAWDQARNAQGFDEGTLPSTRHEAAERRRGRRDRHPHPCGGIARSVAAMDRQRRSEEHTSELQSLMRISYAVFCLKKKNKTCTE